MNLYSALQYLRKSLPTVYRHVHQEICELDYCINEKIEIH